MSNLKQDAVNKEFEDLLDHFADPDDEIDITAFGATGTADLMDLQDSQPRDALRLTNDELNAELEMRGEKPKGFFTDDAKVLQKYFDVEHEEYLAKQMKERAEQQEKLAAQAGLIRRKRLVEKQLKEELLAIQRDRRAEHWLALVRGDATPPQARVELGSVAARCLAKALWGNGSLVSLDLSRNGLDDKAGAFVARALRRNGALVNLELVSNHLGPVTFATFGGSLKSNATLLHLNLEGNPLTESGLAEKTGAPEFADMLKHNNTLTSLNLFRCHLGPEAGTELLGGLEQNASLVFLDVGGNHFLQSHDARINGKIQENQSLRADLKSQAKQAAEKRSKEEAEDKRIQDEIQKERDTKQWLEEQKQKRAEERSMATEEAAAKRKEQIEEAKRIAEEKAEAERKAKADAEAKKKKKGKGKKKK